MKINDIMCLVFAVLCISTLHGCKDENYFDDQKNADFQLSRSSQIQTLPISVSEIRNINIDGEWMLTLNQEEAGVPLKIYIEENSEGKDRIGSIRIIKRNGTSQEFKIKQSETNLGSENSTLDNYERRMGVGWGYDCNSYYGDSRGVRDQIFNPIKIKRLNEKYGGNFLIRDEPLQAITSFNCTGLTSTELSKNMAIEAEVNIGIPCAFSMDVKGRFATSDLQSSSNCFAIKRYKSSIKRRSLELYNILSYVQMGEDVYTYAFKQYLQRLKESDGNLSVIKEFVRVYGNTIVQVSDIGGKVDYNMTIRRSDVSSSKEMEIGVTVGLLSMFSISVSQEEKETYAKMEKNSKFSLMANGGDVTILASAVINNDQCSEDTFHKWLESINDNNAEMIDCKLIPIWELIESNSVANKIKSYVTKERIQEEEFIIPSASSLSARIQVPSFKENETQIKVAWCSGTPIVEFCNEFIPTIDLQKRVIVAYPIKDNKPDYKEGIFIGNKGIFGPGIIRWTGDEYSYHSLTNHGTSDVLSTIYFNNFTITADKTTDETYSDGISKDVYIKCHSREYPIVKVDTIVWFRKNLESALSITGETIKPIIREGTYHYDVSTSINSLPPMNWEVPNVSHIASISKLAPTCRAFMDEKVSGLDIKALGGYRSGETYEEGAFIIVKDKETMKCAQLIELEPIRLNNIIVKAPVRPVRSSTFRYK